MDLAASRADAGPHPVFAVPFSSSPAVLLAWRLVGAISAFRFIQIDIERRFAVDIADDLGFLLRELAVEGIDLGCGVELFDSDLVFAGGHVLDGERTVGFGACWNGGVIFLFSNHGNESDRDIPCLADTESFALACHLAIDRHFFLPATDDQRRRQTDDQHQGATNESVHGEIP